MSKLEPASLPSPLPSPPRQALAQLGNASRLCRTIRDKTELSRIARAAEETRLLHLAKAVYAAAPSASTSSSGVKMMRYSFRVERGERGQKVLRTVTVIVPELSRIQSEADDARTALRQRPGSSFLLIPPPSGHPRARIAPPARRLSLPHLARLSLLPPEGPFPSFVSSSGSTAQAQSVAPRPGHVTLCRHTGAAAVDLTAQATPAAMVQAPLCGWAGEERIPTGAGIDRVAAWAKDQCDRLRQKRTRRSSGGGDGPDETAPPKKKRQRRGQSLGERRGKTVAPLELL